MQNKFIQTVKATILSIIVAFLFVGIVVAVIYFTIGNRIKSAISMVNTISIEKSTAEDVKLENLDGKLQNYPSYGQKYATLKINKIDIELPVYFGDSLEILKKGVGHSSGSYMPGEGGSIIYMAHNSKDRFRRFSELKNGDIVTIETDYGTYQYKIYEEKIIKETDLDAVPVQKEKEILMMYTCYPLNNIGYATQRYVVYASPVEK